MYPTIWAHKVIITNYYRKIKKKLAGIITNRLVRYLSNYESKQICLAQEIKPILGLFKQNLVAFVLHTYVFYVLKGKWPQNMEKEIDSRLALKLKTLKPHAENSVRWVKGPIINRSHTNSSSTFGHFWPIKINRCLQEYKLIFRLLIINI